MSDHCKFEGNNSVVAQVVAAFKPGANSVNEALALKRDIMTKDQTIPEKAAMQKVVENNPDISLKCD